MSWFGKKNDRSRGKLSPPVASRSSKKNRGGGTAGAIAFPWRRFGIVLGVTLLLAGGVTAAVFSASALSSWMRAAVEQRDLPPLEAGQVELVDCPLAANHPVRLRIKELAALAWQAPGGELLGEGASPLSRAGVESIALALANDPWIRDVRRIRRTPDRLLVEAEYRLPRAWVQDRTGSITMVSKDAYVLWKGDSEQRVRELRQQFPEVGLVTGMSGQPPAEGMPWDSERLTDALALLDFLGAWPHADRIVSIDVGENFPATPTLRMEIRLEGNGGMVWGSAPGRELPTEVPADEKLRRLDTLERQHTERVFRDGSRYAIHMMNTITKLSPR